MNDFAAALVSFAEISRLKSTSVGIAGSARGIETARDAQL